MKTEEKDELILQQSVTIQRLEKENKTLRNLCKNVQNAVQLEINKIEEREKLKKEYGDD